MAHFARVNNSIVEQVIVVANDDCAGGNFPDSEQPGRDFIASLGLDGDWYQTSYNGNFRGCYAGVGYTYDADADDFVPPATVEDDAN